MKKYELTDETVWVGSRTLYRVRALCDIPGLDVKEGDTGGGCRTSGSDGRDSGIRGPSTAPVVAGRGRSDGEGPCDLRDCLCPFQQHARGR